MRKYRLPCLLLIACLLLPLGAALATDAPAVYSPEKALVYAKRNWSDSSGNCIPFASRCLKAGGLDAATNNGDFSRFMKKLDKLERGKLYKLSTVAVDVRSLSGLQQVPRTEQNAKIAMAGDLVFWYCASCKDYTHVGVIGEDKQNSISIYARNRAEGNSTPMQAWCYAHEGGEHVSVYAYHVFREGEPAQEEAEAPLPPRKKTKSKKK